MESPSRVQSETYYSTIGSLLCTAASSTPIRVVTKEVRYIHALSLTLEHSMSMSSLAALGLTVDLCQWPRGASPTTMGLEAHAPSSPLFLHNRPELLMC